MCAPRVMGTVKEEISRRRALGLLAAPAVAGAMVQSAGAQAESLLSGDFKNLYDLTHVLSPSVPVFPVVRPMELVEAFTIANEGFFGYDLTLNEHTGTHMDASNHFSEGGLSVDQLQPRQFFAPLAVIDIRARAARDVDTSVTVDDLRAWERQHGELPPGAFVAMNSGWDSRVGSSEQFVNADAQGMMHFPALAPRPLTS